MGRHKRNSVPSPPTPASTNNSSSTGAKQKPITSSFPPPQDVSKSRKHHDSTSPSSTTSSSDSEAATSSSAASASFPYIGVSNESPTTSSSKTSSGHGGGSHHRLGSVSSLRRPIDPVRLEAARAVFFQLIREQTLVTRQERGLSISGDAALDLDAPDAPWCTDDSLLSPDIFTEYCKVPAAIDTVFGSYKNGGLDKDPEGRREFSRWMALTRFGQLEKNIWNIFKRTATAKQHDRAIVWVNGAGAIEKDWTFGELYSRSCVLAHHLRHVAKVERGSRVILCFVPGLEFFVAFWACMAVGLVAVPVTPVDPFNPKSDVSEKLRQIVASCQPSLFLTTSEYVTALDAGRAYVEQLDPSATQSEANSFNAYDADWFSIDSLDYSRTYDPAQPFADAVVDSSGVSLAFLQYTSGSTGAPKGVMVGHYNVCNNVAGCTELTRAGRDFEMYRKTIAVSWLPTFHDMGLQGFHISPLLTGTPCVYFSPLDFLANPCMWLQQLTYWSHHPDYSYVTSGAPPFALELVVKRLSAMDPAERNALELSRVISLIVGAEPIRPTALLAFTAAMEPMGFKAESFMPAYGCAENVLHCAGKKDNSYPPTVLEVSQAALNEGRIVEIQQSDALHPALKSSSKFIVACGELHSVDPEYWAGMHSASGSVLVVDPVTKAELPDGTIGELWITGPCVTAGYWNNAAATAVAFSNVLSSSVTETGKQHLKSSFYRTGDLGAYYQNRLYVVGRWKEIIIVNGTKHYPMDIEEAIRAATASGIPVPVQHNEKQAATVGGAPTRSSVAPSQLIRLRPGGILATEMENPSTGKPELVVIAECELPEAGTDATSSRSSGGGNKSTAASQIALANTVLKGCAYLPDFMRGPAIRTAAKMGARWKQYRKKQNGSAASASNGACADASGVAFSHFDAVERAIRRAVIGRFGIPVAEVVLLKPRAVLKTSSGKIRRAATAQLLAQGGLDHAVLRRSSSKPAAGGRMGAAASIARQPMLSLWEPQSTHTNTSSRTLAPSSCHASSKPFTTSAISSSSPESSSFEMVSPTEEMQRESSSRTSTTNQPLDPVEVKRVVASVLGEELHLDAATILQLSDDFRLDEDATLEQYGLDSLTAMRISGRLTRAFNLVIPLSPFMLVADPTMDGLCKCIIRLKQDRGFRHTSAKEFKRVTKVAGTSNDEQTEPSSNVAATPPATMNIRAAPLPAGAKSNSNASSCPSGSAMPYIFGLGCAVPGPGAPQQAILHVMVTDMQLPSNKAALFDKIGASSGIDRRYSVLPSIESIYWGRKGVGNNESIEVRNTVFKREAPSLSLEAARAALADWGGRKEDITHVVAVTCTGIIVPGLEFGILHGLGLAADTQRLSIQFMGCFGCLSGMKAARAFAAESPANRVLLVCTELCSLHMQLDDRIDNMVGSALFADGSGAMIVGAVPREGETPLFEMHRNASIIIPNTTDMMGWELTNSGMSISLGKAIPDALYSHIDAFAAGMLNGTEAEEVPFNQCLWALHPGGPMILQAISDRLGLSQSHTSAAWTVLRKYGNMSSATLVFVLRELLEQFRLGEAEVSALPPACSPFVPALAFGPGLNTEGCLLKYVAGQVGTESIVATEPS